MSRQTTAWKVNSRLTLGRYGPTFFVSVGLGSKSFTYATVVQLVGAIGSLMAIFLTDYVGRRPLIITGATLLVIFNCLIAGFGTKTPHTHTANNVVVASFVMMLWSTKISWATHCCKLGISHLILTALTNRSQILSDRNWVERKCERRVSMHRSQVCPSYRLINVVIMIGTTVDLIAAWLVSFTSPYIMNEPYGGIGGNIGYIFGGIAALGLVFAILIVPELKVCLSPVSLVGSLLNPSRAVDSRKWMSSSRSLDGAGNMPKSELRATVPPSRRSRGAISKRVRLTRTSWMQVTTCTRYAPYL